MDNRCECPDDVGKRDGASVTIQALAIRTADKLLEMMAAGN
jgi:hypothetical protein